MASKELHVSYVIHGTCVCLLVSDDLKRSRQHIPFGQPYIKMMMMIIQCILKMFTYVYCTYIYIYMNDELHSSLF